MISGTEKVEIWRVCINYLAKKNHQFTRDKEFTDRNLLIGTY